MGSGQGQVSAVWDSPSGHMDTVVNTRPGGAMGVGGREGSSQGGSQGVSKVGFGAEGLGSY